MKKNFHKHVEYAMKWHGSQNRKKVGDLRMPYIIHPLDVMRQLQSWGIADSKHEQLWAAAMFHDLLEDTDLTLSELADDWGRVCADLVLELTFEGDDQDKKAKAEYVASFAEKSIEAVILKIADRLCNIADSLALPNGMEKAYNAYTKAESLFLAFNTRHKEIRDKYGDGVFVEMAKAISAYGMIFNQQTAPPAEPAAIADSPSE